MIVPEIHFKRVEREHIPGIMQLCAEEGWPSYAEQPEITWQALTAPGVCSLVALEGEEVIGVVQMQSDGHIQAHLSLLAVAAGFRRLGIGRRLVEQAFALSGAKRIDLVASLDAEDFYRTFPHQAYPGFRIYPNHRGER